MRGRNPFLQLDNQGHRTNLADPLSIKYSASSGIPSSISGSLPKIPRLVAPLASRSRETTPGRDQTSPAQLHHPRNLRRASHRERLAAE